MEGKKGLGWGFDPDSPPGSGLWCTRAGKHLIYFAGPPEVTEKVKNGHFSHSQGHYVASIPGSDEVYTPTKHALKVGAIHEGFIVQHTRKNPTHKFGWCPRIQRPVLLPLRWVEEEEEFSFNYHWDKGQDVPSEPDSPNTPDSPDSSEDPDSDNPKLDI